MDRQTPHTNLLIGIDPAKGPALPDGWYLTVTLTVDRMMFSICWPKSKSHGRNPIISRRRAQVVTFPSAACTAWREDRS